MVPSLGYPRDLLFEIFNLVLKRILDFLIILDDIRLLHLPFTYHIFIPVLNNIYLRLFVFNLSVE